MRTSISSSSASMHNSTSSASLSVSANSISLTLYMAVLACCIFWMALSNSSYFFAIFPVKNEKMWICQSGRENVIKDDKSGESMIHVGIDFDWKEPMSG